MIVNAGAHLHVREQFTAAIPRFIYQLDGLNRPHDIIMFRTLVPGHKNCSSPSLGPFSSFQEYKASVEGLKVKATYNWDVFSSYNDVMAQLVEDREQTDDKARTYLLDVFPMTVLRPDGHVGDDFRVKTARRTDCLHYSLPGPVDWWVHLMLSNLNDMSLISGIRIDR
mmetsp:Transcript_14059/g.20252  ORF Transcript_14059/g.20252 Transcript_14059/m.20252 type:complete len:168 (-) Transcript_14059:8-511(-)